MVNRKIRKTPLKSLAKIQAKELRKIASNMRMGLERRGNARAELKRRGLKGLPRVAAQRGKMISKKFIKETRKRRIIG